MGSGSHARPSRLPRAGACEVQPLGWGEAAEREGAEVAAVVTYPTQAFMTERIRLLEEALRTASFAFSDALLALREEDLVEVADRLATRWPEVEVTP